MYESFQKDQTYKVWEVTGSYFYLDSIYCISMSSYSLTTRLILGLKAIPVGFLQL